jgi:FkbM family methyltransferase
MGTSYEWPDPRKADSVLRDSLGILKWLEHHAGRRECVQAGACVGVFPATLAQHYETVYCAEIAADNFACLQRNAMPSNVRAFHAALGEKPGRVAVHREHLPISHYVQPGDEIQVLTIDGWSLERCDLIALDVEGYEWMALKGAEQTLRRCKPLLVIETKGHGKRFGYEDAEMAAWLTALGYTKVDRVRKDDVWKA